MSLSGKGLSAALGAVGARGGQMRSYAQLARDGEHALAMAPSGLTVKGAAAWLATLAMESAYFRTTTEYGSGQWYAPWIGRGFVQVTHESNYAAFGVWCHRRGLVSSDDYFTEHPKRLADYQWAWWTGLWYFEYADLWKYANRGDFLAVSQGVNGGTGTIGTSFTPYGWVQRKAMYEAFRAAGKDLLPGKDGGDMSGVTANGWPRLNRFEGAFTAPTGQVCPVANDDLARLFAYVAWRMDTEVLQPMTSAYGGRTEQQQRDLYASMGKAPDLWSNHISGTACDFARPGVTYELFQTGTYTSGYSRGEEARIRRICADTGVMQWGGDYPAGVRDPVHVQVRGNLSHFGQRPISRAEVSAAAKRIAGWVRDVQTVVGATADGYAGPGTIQAVRDWQKDQGLTPDGAFGPASQKKAGWQDGEPTADEGVLGMTSYKNTSVYRAKQPLKKGTWRTLKLGPHAYTLLVCNGKPWLAEVDVQATGIGPGDSLQLRFIVVNYRKGHKTTRAVTYKIDEHAGTTGSTFAHIFQMGSAGAGKGSTSRRLRIEALSTAKDAQIVSVNAKMMKE